MPLSAPSLAPEVGGKKARTKLEEGEWIVPPSRKAGKVARELSVSPPLGLALMRPAPGSVDPG